MVELGNWKHLCIDMQRLFAEDTPWHVQWMASVLRRWSPCHPRS